jgi:hypothetical protein
LATLTGALSQFPPSRRQEVLFDEIAKDIKLEIKAALKSPIVKPTLQFLKRPYEFEFDKHLQDLLHSVPLIARFLSLFSEAHFKRNAAPTLERKRLLTYVALCTPLFLS